MSEERNMTTPGIALLASAAGAAANDKNPAHDAKKSRQGRGGAGQDQVEDDVFFKRVEWSADGTTVVASSSDDSISSFILPADLLSPRGRALPLRAQGTLHLPEPSNAVASSPYFSLSAPYTQAVLVACHDHPLQLYPAFPAAPDPRPLAAYRLIKRETEAYQRVTSLLWPAPGTHFTAGTLNLLAHFDVTRGGGGGPVHSLPTIPSTRHLAKGGGVGMRGAVTALSLQHPDAAGLLAAGTLTRWVGLYDLSRSDAHVATWSVAGAAAEDLAPGPSGSGIGGIGGGGVMQTAWSPCGRYLVVNERQSAGLLVYDVRVTGTLLAQLAGRDGATNQRLECDVFPGSADGPGGFEVWAGTRDGRVAVWDGVGFSAGAVGPSWDWAVVDQGAGWAVGAAALHPSGSVVATCCGSRTEPGARFDADSDSEVESSDGSRDGSSAESYEGPGTSEETTKTSLKLWSIGASAL